MKIAISSEPKLLPVLYGAVRWQALEHGFSGADSEALALAIEKAAGEVIHSTYSGRPGLTLSLEMAVHPDRLEFVLEDSGPKAMAAPLSGSSPGKNRPSGSGSRLQTAFDAISYDPDFRGGNRLKLVKFLPGRVVRRE